MELRGHIEIGDLAAVPRATEAKLAKLLGRVLSCLDLLAVLIDAMHVDKRLVLVALSVDSAGRKHPLGLGRARRSV